MPTIDVSPGDALDPYLDGDLTGETIQIPAGTYSRNGDWSVTLSGTTIEGAGGQVVIDHGNGHNLETDWMCDSDSAVRDLTFAGQMGSGGPQSSMEVQASAGSTLAFENCRWPDGSQQVSDAHCMYLDPAHSGTIELLNCHVDGFSDNGVYGSQPGAGGGILVVEGCTFRNNNVASVRFGGSGSYAQNCKFEVTSGYSGDSGGGHNPRGVWIHSSGEYSIENCEFVYDSSGSPINAVHEAAAGSTTEVRDCVIRQDGSGPAMQFSHSSYPTGSASGGGNHITGSGNLSTPGAGHVVACRGSGCQTPGDPGGSTGDHTLEIDTESGIGSTPYSVTSTGQIFHGPESEPSTDDIAQNSDGTWTVTGDAGSGYGDSFSANGQLVSVDAPDGVTVLWDGSVVDGDGDGDGNGDGGQPATSGTALLALGLLSAAAAAEYRRRRG